MTNKQQPNRSTNLPAAAPSSYHTPVMLNEALDGLSIKPSGTYVDCTFGGGGHSKAILSKLDNTGKLVAFDQDKDAISNAPDDERFLFIPQNFRHLQRFLQLHKIKEIDGLLADLGVSSHQFDEASRGFSIRFNAPLDMRMDNRQPLTAADIINTYPAVKLHKIFEQFGEVTNSKTLAEAIVGQRKMTEMQTVEQFKKALQGLVKGNPNKYFAQVFQALRIEVNDELGALKEMLQQSVDLLKPGGRIAVITFHSLEDRLVKNFFKEGTFEEQETDSIYGNKPVSRFKIITKKPVIATAEEIKANPRSRSAKLRVAEKV
jgi:16S rRNA (cytosine1402-N4)-methyltransferase